jgi:hypothetical protein
MKIHLWEAYDPEDISVDLNKEFKNKIKIKIEHIYIISQKKLILFLPDYMSILYIRILVSL